MKKRDKLKLTKNEKEVLKQIVDQGKVSDTDISEDMPISQQAVYQIRKRLEDVGIIEGYSPIINYEKIGIKIFTFVGVEILFDYWERSSEAEINKIFYDLPCTYGLYRVPSSDISYILILGFKGLIECERFMKDIEVRLSKIMKTKWTYSFSVKNILKDNGLNLVYHAFDEKKEGIKKLLDKFKK